MPLVLDGVEAGMPVEEAKPLLVAETLDERPLPMAELLPEAARLLVTETPVPEIEPLPDPDAVADDAPLPVPEALADDMAEELPDGAAPDEELADILADADEDGARPDDEDEGAADSHGSLMNSTPVGPITRDAVVPPTSTISVKTDGKAAPLDAHGTGMIFTKVPMVVVMVEHAVTVPVGSISPLVMKTSGGGSAGAWGKAYTGSRGSNDRREKKIAILGCSERREIQPGLKLNSDNGRNG